MKFKQKQATKILAGILLFGAIILTAPVAFADLVPPTCDGLNASKDGKDGTKGWVISILEEQISAPTKSNTAAAEKALTTDTKDTVQAGVIDCMRVTTKKSDKLESSYENIANSCPADSSCQHVQVFFSQSGTGLLFTYIGMIYRWAAGVIGMVSVLFLVWGGVEIATAGDNPGKIDTAKTRIMQSLGGLALLFLSAIILYTINPNFFTM